MVIRSAGIPDTLLMTQIRTCTTDNVADSMDLLPGQAIHSPVVVMYYRMGQAHIPHYIIVGQCT